MPSVVMLSWTFYYCCAKCRYAECHYVESRYAQYHHAGCHILFIDVLNAIVLNVIMLNVIMLNVIMLNVIMLSVMALCILVQAGWTVCLVSHLQGRLLLVFHKMVYKFDPESEFCLQGPVL
jgi:hypothetical protein